jgi:Rrf2 family protein
MQFSASVVYAVKAMLYLARAYQVDIASVKEISEKEGIPFKFLEQLFRKLRLTGLVTSHRGKEGGYSLSIAPSSITFLDVYQAIEGKLVMSNPNDELSWISDKVTDALVNTLSVSLEAILFQSDQVQRSYSI